MDPASEALPDDVAALKAALIAERARRLEVAAELAVAQAKASEDMALIAAQKLRIAKLERQVFGQRSERSARLVDQLALEFEELEASAAERISGNEPHTLAPVEASQYGRSHALFRPGGNPLGVRADPVEQVNRP